LAGGGGGFVTVVMKEQEPTRKQEQEAEREQNENPDGYGYGYRTNIYPAGRVRGSYYPYPTRPVDIHSFGPPYLFYDFVCLWFYSFSLLMPFYIWVYSVFTYQTIIHLIYEISISL